MDIKHLIIFAIYFIEVLSTLLFWAIFIHVILSWFAVGRTRLGMWLEQIVRPIFRLFRWARIGMFDFSPILALLVIDFVGRYIVELLKQLLV
ncbi:YggT family protein [Candidatus Gracilibacteria bacterium]|nr:YggT family protein [Candidatus Gracilibacteria bacterium]MCF7819039.1 YggT family protein [Candidatus Gracilibacteria bacterium]